MRQSLYLQLTRLADERWTRRALRRVLRSAWLALCIWCIGVGLALVLGRIPDLQLIGAIALGVLGIGLLLLLFERRMPPDTVARRLDQRFQLQEQLSTALEVASQRPEQESVAAALLDHSTTTMRHVRRRIAQRQRQPWSDLITCLALAIVAAGLLILAGIGRPDTFIEPTLPPPLLGAAGEPPPDEPLDPTQGDQQGLPGAGAEGEIPLLGDTTDPSEGPGQPGAGANAEQGQPGTQGQGQPQAGQQGGQPGAQQQPVTNPSAQRNLDAIADALRDQGVTRPAADALDRGNLRAAAQQLRELADQADQLSDATRRDLASSLRRAASQVQQDNPQLSQELRDIARDLERGNDRAAQALDSLAQAIERQAGIPPEAAESQPGQGQPGATGGQEADGQAGGQTGDPGEGQGEGDQPGNGGGAGNAGAGEQRPVENPERLGVDGQPVQLDVQGEGGTTAPPPEDATAGGVSAVGGTSGGSAGAEDGGSGEDPLRVPLDERDVVQDYFTP